jgi:sulfite exporter TauE/SafE
MNFDWKNIWRSPIYTLLGVILGALGFWQLLEVVKTEKAEFAEVGAAVLLILSSVLGALLGGDKGTPKT